MDYLLNTHLKGHVQTLLNKYFLYKRSRKHQQKNDSLPN